MRHFIELDGDGIAASEVFTESAMSGDRIVEVTGRSDGPWIGKRYDQNTDTFTVVDRFAGLPVADISIKNANDEEVDYFVLGDEIRVSVAMRHPLTNEILANFEQLAGRDTFIVEISGEAGSVPVLFQFTNGQASRTFAQGTPVFAPGRYSVGDNTSTIARVPAKTIYIVL